MSFTTKCAFLFGILMAGTFAWSSQSAAQVEATASPPASSEIQPRLDAGDSTAKTEDGAAYQFCPAYCNSAAQCTTGCHTESLCMNHQCVML